MKKLLLMAIFATFVGALTSCSNDETLSSYTENQVCEENAGISVYSDLQEQIITFNDTFFDSEQAYTRGIFKRWKWLKWAVVGFADAIGSLGGGALGAMCSGVIAPILFDDVSFATLSYGSLNTCSSTSIVNSSDVVFSYIVPKLSNEISEKTDSVGFYHNEVLFNLFNDVDVSSIESITQEELATIIITELLKEPYKYYYFGDGIVTDAEVKSLVTKSTEIVNTILEAADDSESLDEFFEKLYDMGNEYKDVIPILKEIIYGLYLLGIDADDGEYYQALINIVDASNVEEDFKVSLINSVVVAQASHRLWKMPEEI